jgi:hypothetical protein
MPPFVPLADGAQVEILFTQGLFITEDRLWFVSRQPPITQAQLDNLAAGVASWHASEVMPLLSDNLLLTNIVATDWTNISPPFVANSSPIVSGGNSSGCHSANVSYRVAFHPDSSAPRLVNSNFVPGIPKDKVNTNTIDSSWASDLRDAYIDLIDLAAGFGTFPAWRWVCTSRFHAGAWRSTQLAARTDFIRTPSKYISPRRRRITRLRRL